MSRQREQRGTRVGLALVDIGVVVVVVGFVAAFLTLRHDQTRYDGEARRIAAWARGLGVGRIAWPIDLRASVPTLIDSHVTPVLIDARPPVPQDAALNDAAIVVTRRGARIAAPVRAQLATGALVARLVDLRAAANVPIEPGQAVGEQIARPYVYAPLRDARRIVPGDPFVTNLVLAPANYVLRVEGFDPRQRAQLRLVVTGQSLRIQGAQPLHRVVDAPIELHFRVSGSAPDRVRVVMSAVGGGDARALMQAWSVAREATST